MKVTIYGKQGCCLCDEAEKMLRELSAEYSLEIEKIDITSDEGLFEKYRYIIPVVALNDEITFELKISRYRLEKALRQLQSGAAVKRCFPAAKG